MDTNGSSAERLALQMEILALIDARRQSTGAPMLGASIERFILQSHCSEVEAEILENPGAFESWLVRRRA